MQWDGSAWQSRGSTIPGESAGDEAGRSLALSADGNVLALGSPYHDALVADPVSVPADLAGYYSEALLHVASVFSASTHAVNHPDVPYLAPVSRKV